MEYIKQSGVPTLFVVAGESQPPVCPAASIMKEIFSTCGQTHAEDFTTVHWLMSAHACRQWSAEDALSIHLADVIYMEK